MVLFRKVSGIHLMHSFTRLRVGKGLRVKEKDFYWTFLEIMNVFCRVKIFLMNSVGFLVDSNRNSHYWIGAVLARRNFVNNPILNMFCVQPKWNTKTQFSPNGLETFFFNFVHIIIKKSAAFGVWHDGLHHF